MTDEFFSVEDGKAEYYDYLDLWMIYTLVVTPYVIQICFINKGGRHHDSIHYCCKSIFDCLQGNVFIGSSGL